MRNRTTKEWENWWRQRKIDWKESYLSTWNHPHRQMLVAILARLSWISLYEVGCGAGANLVKIVQSFPNKPLQLGGSDVNPEAIELAKQTLAGARLKVETAEDIMMSDDSTDIVMSDMTLIYLSNPNKAIKEMKRVARKYVVLCELHSDNIFKRWLEWFRSGYNIHNYQTLLDKHGFYDIIFYKIPKNVWDGKPQVPFGFIITAKVPKRK